MNYNDFLGLDENRMNDIKPTTEQDLISDRVRELIQLGKKTKTAVFDHIKNEKSFRDLVKKAKSNDEAFNGKAFVEKCFEKFSK